MFGAPVVEETPRIQYGATAFGVLGETVNETSRTLFGQPEPPPATYRREQYPIDPSVFLKDSAGMVQSDDSRSQRTADWANPNGSDRSDAMHGDGKANSRHAHMQAVLQTMNTPTTEVRPGSHLYDTLRHSKLLFGSVTDPSTNSRSSRGAAEDTEGFLPVDAGLSSNARRLMQIPAPPFPPGQLSLDSLQYGGYYSVDSGLGYYGLGIAAALHVSAGL